MISKIVKFGTIRFCDHFLNRRNDPCGRTFDQMMQAARSGWQNIVDGPGRAETFKESDDGNRQPLIPVENAGK